MSPRKHASLTCLGVNGTGPNLLGRDWLTHIKLDWSAVHRIEHADFTNMFPDLFKDGLGKLKGVEAKLYIDKEAIPRCFKPRSVPVALRAKVDNQLQRLETNGVIVHMGEIFDKCAIAENHFTSCLLLII